MKNPNLLFTMLLAMLISISSCTSNDSNDSSDTEKSATVTIVGKWHNYKRVINGKTYTDTGADPISNLNYEFQTNACIITDEGDVTNYNYKVDGDYIKFYSPKTEALTGSEKINSLTKDELVVVSQYNSNTLKYFKKL